MPIHPNVRRCTHIQVTGHRCGSPALKQQYFCYFHTRMIKGVETRVDAQIHPVALIENAEAIQAAIMHTIDAVLKGAIDNKRANIILKALSIAVRNSRNVYFGIRQDDMVREVPNYAEQYFSEHPESNSPNTHIAPDAPARAAEQSPATPSRDLNSKNHGCEDTQQKECHPEEAEACVKRAPANKGPVHALANTAPRAQSADPATPTPANPPKQIGQKAWGQNIPPLTTRQSERWNEIKQLEASIEGATRGNWRDLRTVFNAVGLTPRTPPRKDRVGARVLARAPVK